MGTGGLRQKIMGKHCLLQVEKDLEIFSCFLSISLISELWILVLVMFICHTMTHSIIIMFSLSFQLLLTTLNISII